MNFTYIIKNIVDGELEQENINQILKHCYSISYSTWNNLPAEIFNKNSASLDDLAINSVVPLFSKNGDDKLKIESYLNSKKDNLKEESDIQFLLHKLVWERVERDICWQMVLEDSRFEKIHYELFSLIELQNYKRVYYLSNSYIVSTSINQINGSVISLDKFKELPDYLFSDESSVIVERILRHLKEEIKYFPAIPFVSLVLRIKESSN